MGKIIRKKIGSQVVSGPKYNRDDYKFVHAILDGETFESYAERTGVTRQAVNKRFWLTFVNLYPSFKNEAIDKDINKLRRIWSGMNV